MNLAIDIGNTRAKYGVFEGNKILSSGVLAKNPNTELEKLFTKYPISKSILCQVGKTLPDLEALLEKESDFSTFTSATPIPIQNKYHSASTLGSDRLVSAIGSYTLFPNSNVLTIDSGTCIKYNFVNQKNEYLGGAISAGIDMRFKALNEYTEKLPLLRANYNYTNSSLIGKSTDESIQSGVMLASLAEIEKTIEWYLSSCSDLKIVLTGGNHTFFADQLKTKIFADPLLILKGLNEIICFNT